MRTLTLFSAALVSVLGLAMAAQAATITVVSDKPTYDVGETITLTITGVSGSTSDTAIFGQILFDGSLVTGLTTTQNMLTSFSGGLPWTLGVLTIYANAVDSFNQLVGTTPFPADQNLVSIITLSADATGTVNITWDETGGVNGLDYFGLTSGAGTTSFDIVPEPTTAGLLGLGLLGLLVSGRRRR